MCHMLCQQNRLFWKIEYRLFFINFLDWFWKLTHGQNKQKSMHVVFECPSRPCVLFVWMSAFLLCIYPLRNNFLGWKYRVSYFVRLRLPTHWFWLRLPIFYFEHNFDEGKVFEYRIRAIIGCMHYLKNIFTQVLRQVFKIAIYSKKYISHQDQSNKIDRLSKGKLYEKNDRMYLKSFFLTITILE